MTDQEFSKRHKESRRPHGSHPIQPLVRDEHGTIRFRKNAIVEYLLDNGRVGLNELACMGFSNDDFEQFAQLIGYSLRGFSELSYVSDETYDEAEAMSPDSHEQW